MTQKIHAAESAPNLYLLALTYERYAFMKSHFEIELSYPSIPDLYFDQKISEHLSGLRRILFWSCLPSSQLIDQSMNV